MTDLQVLTSKLLEEKKTSLEFVAYEKIQEETILTLVGQALAHFQLEYLENIIATVLNEMINNACKANLKRVFFHKYTKDINNKQEYTTLINRFKEEAIVRIREYKKILEDQGMFIHFQIQMDQEGILLQVVNNVEMTKEEKIRADERLKNAKNLKNMSEAFELFASDEEGAGLGIVLNIQLLKNAGIDSKCFKIISENGKTISEITIPSEIKKPENLEKIYNRVINEIKGIPIFSEDVQNILKMIQEDNYSHKKILELLEIEPGLASEILKEANLISGSKEKFDSLPLALQRLGQKGVFQAVSTCSTRKILQMRYNDFQKYWKFSRQCAFYAKELPSLLDLNISVERLYLGGLFHNLGKLIIYSIQDEFSHSLVNTTLEEIEFGVSHAQIGSLVAERWGYSNQLVSLIKNYTRPLVGPQEIQLEACILHLADYMIRSEAKYDKFVYLDINSIFYLGIKNRQTILEIHQILLNKFNHFNSHSLA